MHHETSLIALIAVGLTLAFALGFVAARLRLPALVGYLLTGVAIGPFTPGFVGDVKAAHQLAEIGVILLMFGVGMHFSIHDLWAVRKLALPGAVVQIAAATALGAGVSYLWGWSPGAGLVFGLALSVASTVVLLKALEARDRLDTDDGRLAVGWLIVEDLAIVLALVLLPALAGPLGGKAAADGGNLWATLGVALGKVAAFITLMLVVGTRVFPWLLKKVAGTGSRELFTLAVVGQSVGIAYAATEVFGVSFALGAFFAGMVLNASDVGHKAVEKLQPLEDVFAVLFFVSVGMLFDPRVLVDQPPRVAAVVGIIVVGKSIAALGIVLALGGSRGTALSVSAALAQIGEFSFILAGLGVALELMPPEGQSLVVAGAILSITLNPLAFRLADRWTRPPAPDRPAHELVAAEAR
ncbi:cation:proton antiporter [bacterium]|nr:cation:proton antiporter [bacterium]